MSTHQNTLIPPPLDCFVERLPADAASALAKGYLAGVRRWTEGDEPDKTLARARATDAAVAASRAWGFVGALIDTPDRANGTAHPDSPAHPCTRADLPAQILAAESAAFHAAKAARLLASGEGLGSGAVPREPSEQERQARVDALAPRLYRGRRLPSGEVEVWRPDGTPLPLKPSLALHEHSPTGFEWGYPGSGPAQLALALVLDVTGLAYAARRTYQALKDEMVVGWAESWTLEPDELLTWVDDELHHRREG